MTLPLTRRRDHRCRHEETWHIYYGDVRVGTTSQRTGVPLEVDQWGWTCGFCPDLKPGQDTNGTGADFEAARAGFEEAWNRLLPTLTEAAFEEYRRHRDLLAEIRAKRARGEKLDTEIPTSMMRCFCGVMFDTHKPEESWDHRGHIYAAQIRRASCPVCEGCGWVCEDHRDRPWEGRNACSCRGSAGAPCPVCNRAEGCELPRPPFTPDDESKRDTDIPRA
jgi:hypothetical protein